MRRCSSPNYHGSVLSLWPIFYLIFSAGFIWLPSMIFETTVFLFTIVKLYQKARETSHLGSNLLVILYRDGVCYYFVSLFLSFTIDFAWHWNCRLSSVHAYPDENHRVILTLLYRFTDIQFPRLACFPSFTHTHWHLVRYDPYIVNPADRHSQPSVVNHDNRGDPSPNQPSESRRARCLINLPLSQVEAWVSVLLRHSREQKPCVHSGDHYYNHRTQRLPSHLGLLPTTKYRRATTARPRSKRIAAA